MKHDARLGTLLVDARLTKPRGLDDKDIDSEPTILHAVMVSSPVAARCIPAMKDDRS